MNNLEKAKSILKDGGYTCVLCGNGKVYTSVERGVAPMLKFLEQGVDLRGFSAADKVIGKAAAFLFVLAEVSEVHTDVISESARDVFAKHNIDCSYDVLVDNIANRAGTGLCPMETATKNISDPDEAVVAIKNKLAEILAQNNSKN